MPFSRVYISITTSICSLNFVSWVTSQYLSKFSSSRGIATNADSGVALCDFALAYENLGIQNEIKKDGEYVMLEKIVSNAISNPTLAISRLRKEYDSIREIGNYAAHRVLYNTRKKDIDDIKQTYRVCLEELYYKAGLLK